MVRRCIVGAIRRNAGILGKCARAEERARVAHTRVGVGGYIHRVRGNVGAADGYSGLRASSGQNCVPGRC